MFSVEGDFPYSSPAHELEQRARYLSEWIPHLWRVHGNGTQHSLGWPPTSEMVQSGSKAVIPCWVYRENQERKASLAEQRGVLSQVRARKVSQSGCSENISSLSQLTSVGGFEPDY